MEKSLGISDLFDKGLILGARPALAGGGTDGASVNIGQHKSIRERFQKLLPWMFWSWCYAYRPKKRRLSSRLFKSAEEMLLRLICTKIQQRKPVN